MRWDRRTLRTVGGTVATAVLVVVAMLVTTGHAGVLDTGGSPAPSATGSHLGSEPCLPVEGLPAQGRDTLRLIEGGGPFPYDQDGTVFGNYEQHLPAEPRGSYHEYTVITPGEGDRGARRIIAGPSGDYYTADHYATFTLICRQ